MADPNVKTLRTKLGLTQEALASLLGFSFVSVNRWENGGSTPTGLSAVFLSLLRSALRVHTPKHVIQSLNGAGGDPLTIVRILTDLERRHE